MFKVGNKVKIKKFKNNIPPHIVSSMGIYFGKILTIYEVNKHSNSYVLKECIRWTWKKTDFEESDIFKQLHDNLFEI